MRALSMPIVLLCGACTFKVVEGGGADSGPHGDGDGGVRVDSAQGTPYRKRITIDRARVSGAQAQFPVWIVLDGDAGLEEHATQEGFDIYFTAGDGTPIPYQIQRWTKSAGRLEAWVRADLDDAADTVIELRYGDPSRASVANPAQVFASSFAAVWHLDDRLDTDAVAEATSKRPGSTGGGLGPADQIAAQLGGGIDFDGVDDRILFTSPFIGSGDHTISAWVNQRTTSDCDSIVTVGSPAGGDSRFFHSNLGSRLAAGFYGNDWPAGGANTLPSIEDAGWVLLHWVFKGSNRQSRMYRNGVQLGPTYTFGGGIDTQGTDGNIGFAPAQWGTCWLNGILDEVRLATSERTADWIATEHANQSSPQTFYAVGDEERAP